MSTYKVITDDLEGVQSDMSECIVNINGALESMMDELMKLDECMVNSKTDIMKQQLYRRKLDTLSALTSLRRHIGTLTDIACEYAQTERRNTDEANSVN